MQSIYCPYCDAVFDEEDMTFGSAKRRRLLAADSTREDVVDYLFMDANVRGPVEELWYHSFGCRRWFLVTRDTRSNLVLSSRSLEGEGQDG